MTTIIARIFRDLFGDIRTEIYRIELWLAVGMLVVVHYLWEFLTNREKNIPPGPIGLPILGYIPFLTENVHLKFMELSQKYGEVFSIQLGSENVVVLSGTASIKEAYGKLEFLGRPPSSAFSLLGNKSPFFAPILNVWHEQRRFVVQALKELGFRKSKIEGHIHEEICHFIDRLKSYNGEPIDLMKPLTPSTSNNIGALIYGHRYEYDHPDRVLFDESLNEVSTVVAQTAFHVFFPWIRYVPFLMKWFDLERGVAAAKRSDNLLMKKIEEHKITLDPKNIRDFIDYYLIELKNRKEKDLNTTFSEPTLVATAGDLFGAGSETVRTSISWCFYIMAAFPEVQKQVQEEILNVLGPDKTPEIQDQKSMPYTHSVILEIMRWKTVVPLNILRYTTADTTVGGYGVLKNTVVMANLWAIHHDPKLWKYPDNFIPERFLSSDMKTIAKPIHFMPFSVGKRACPGEEIANMEIFLYFVSLLQKFDVKLPEGETATFDAELFISYRLKPYKICFIPKT